jgi:hypothetical protein
MNSSKADRNLNAVSLIVGIPLAIVLFIWAGWITVTAFVGGQAPFFFVAFEGVNPIRGLFWLIIVDPLVLTVAYWVFMLVMLPIGALAAGIGKATDRN